MTDEIKAENKREKDQIKASFYNSLEQIKLEFANEITLTTETMQGKHKLELGKSLLHLMLFLSNKRSRKLHTGKVLIVNYSRRRTMEAIGT